MESLPSPGAQSLIEALQLGVTFYMIGVIWLVQLGVYPGFRRVDASAFGEFHRGHSRAISIVVGPAMTLELAAGFYLAIAGVSFAQWIQWLCLGLVLAIWTSTAALQVPDHRRLSNGKDDQVITRLVSSNWIRTWLWTIKGAILIGVRVL